MPWLVLTVAILVEVLGATCMKLSNGFSHLTPTLGVIACYFVSFVGVIFALKHIDLAIVYATWSGIGTALIALIGAYYFNEPITGLKIVSLGLIIVGVAGLQVSAGHG